MRYSGRDEGKREARGREAGETGQKEGREVGR